MDSNAFTKLFTIYSESQKPECNSIAAHLRDVVARENESNPLVIVTGSQLIVFVPPKPTPDLHDFRLDVRGFFEMASISHLGPALGSLVTAYTAGAESWLADATRLATQLELVEAANTASFWGSLAVPAWKGKEEAICRLVGYACRLSKTWLDDFQKNPAKRTFESLVQDYLAVRSPTFPISYDQVMVATFALATLGGVSGSLSFLAPLELDWSRALVLFAGQTGGATAGLNRCTNHLYNVLSVASRGALDPARVFFNPFLVIAASSGGTPDWSAVEKECRTFWAVTASRTQLAGRMFPGYPKFAYAECEEATVTPATREISKPPRVTSAQDLFGFGARLRFMMENPAQLLSSTVAPFLIDQLAAGNTIESVAIPGFTGVSYP
jgi:hypothetical protein